jgi:hypothetical protein
MKPDSIFMKVLLTAAILLYPFYIYPLEGLFYIVSTYIWNLLLSNTYDNGYGKTNIEYGLNGTSGSFGAKGMANDGANDVANDEPPGSSSMDISRGGRPTTRPIENPPASTTPAIYTPTPSPLPKFSYSPIPTLIPEETPVPTSTAQPAVDFMDDSE